MERARELLLSKLSRNWIEEIKVKHSDDAYNAVHFVLIASRDWLGPAWKRAHLGKRVEVQLVTVLNHAWAEMEHDISYKTPELVLRFDRARAEKIHKRFQSVMKDHIKQASYEFESLHKQFRDLQAGVEVFDRELLVALGAAASLNDMAESLVRLAERVDQFGDKSPEGFNLIALLRELVHRGHAMTPVTIDTPWGSLPGKTFDDVAEAIVGILRSLRYRNPEEVLEGLRMLLPRVGKEAHQKVLKTVGEVAEYHPKVISRIGLRHHERVVAYLEAWSDPDFCADLEMACSLCSVLLTCELGGAWMTSPKTLSIALGVVRYSPALSKVRRRTLTILRRMYAVAPDTKARRIVLAALWDAFSWPQQTKRDAKLEQMIVRDTVKELRALQPALSRAEWSILRFIETRLTWISRYDSERIRSEVSAMIRRICSDSGYQKYRTLVGNDIDYSRRQDIRTALERREREIRGYVAATNARTWPRWKSLLTRVARELRNEDGVDSSAFGKYLYWLAQAQPALSSQVILALRSEVHEFVPVYLRGLFASETPEMADTLVRGLARSVKDLAGLASTLVQAPTASVHTVLAVGDEAIRRADADALCAVLLAIPGNRNAGHLTSFWISGVKWLTGKGSSDWAGQAFRSEWKPFLISLSPEGRNIVLESLIARDKITHESEHVLRDLLGDDPRGLTEFFLRRISLATAMDREQAREFEAIPHHFAFLGPVWEEGRALSMRTVLKWLKGRKPSELLSAGMLFHAIAPTLEGASGIELVNWVRRVKRPELEAAVELLGEYDGEAHIHPVIQEIARRSAGSTRLQTGLILAMTKTGVVTGEFGLAEAWEKQLEFLKQWKVDDNKALAEWVKRARGYLEEQITAERRRAMLDYEVAKRTFS